MLVQEPEINTFASKIGLSPNELIRQSLLSFVWDKLQSVRIQIMEMQKKYKIEKVEDFDVLYQKGEVEESDTWEDVQKFDRLSYELNLYETFLKDLI